jgi:hypothetical protein
MANDNGAGNIPTELSELGELQSLRLDGNKLSGYHVMKQAAAPYIDDIYAGKVPAELSQLSCWKGLHLHTNLLTGNHAIISVYYCCFYITFKAFVK